jgi:hypothetical protein
MIGVNLIFYASHISACSTQGVNTICLGDLTSKTRVGNNTNIIYSYAIMKKTRIKAFEANTYW